MSLVMLGLSAHGVEGEVAWQTDFGEEFEGSSPHLWLPHYGKGMDGIGVVVIFHEIVPGNEVGIGKVRGL